MFDRVTIKYAGRYFEWELAEMDVPQEGATDEQVKTAVMQRLDAAGEAVDNLNDFVVDPPEAERTRGQHEDKTVLNLRPPATYG